MIIQQNDYLGDLSLDKATHITRRSKPTQLEYYRDSAIITGNHYRICILFDHKELSRDNVDLANFLRLAIPNFELKDITFFLNSIGFRTREGRELKSNNVSGVYRWMTP